MTPRERVERAFRLEETDRPPYTLWYGDGVPERITAFLGGEAWRRRTVDHIFRLAIEWEPQTPIDDTHYRDLYGAVWRKGNPLHLVTPPLKQPSLQGFNLPEIAGLLDVERFRAQIETQRRDKFVVLGYGFGVFERAWMLRGYENFCMDLFDAPGFVRALMDGLTETHLALLDCLARLPCDGIIFSDDFSDQRGVILGPGPWREIVKPCYRRLYGRVHDLGLMTLQHSCGNVADIAGDLADVGLDVLQCLQPEAMSPYQLKRLHGHRLRFWGGLGTQQLLPYGTPQQVRDEVLRLTREMGRGGGYVFTTAKPIFKEVPVENAVAVIATLLELHGETL